MNIMTYHIDLNTTTSCNLRCKYCIEGFTHDVNFSKDSLPELYKRVDYLMEHPWFKQNYSMVSLNFWGGEPFVNFSTMKELIEHYGNNNKIFHLIYSNGFRWKQEYFDLLSEYKTMKCLDGSDKIKLQVSYDGRPLQDLYRVTATGNPSSKEVLETIDILIKYNIPFANKATCPVSGFMYLADSIKDYLNIWNSIPSHLRRSSGMGITVDYLNQIEASKEDLENLKQALIDIIPTELDYFKKNGRHFINWFNPNRALCSAGRDMGIMDIDGNFYKCHGTLYNPDKLDHLVSSKDDDLETFVQSIKKSHELHLNLGEPEECKKCPVHFCLRCNSQAYRVSKKVNYKERWDDYPAIKVCSVYQTIHKVWLAMERIKKEGI